MNRMIAACAVTALAAFSTAAFAGSTITNDLSKCGAGKGPAIKVNVSGIKSGTGKIRLQNYPGTSSAWLAKGRWLQRIETGARAGSMSFCVPVAAAGTYAIAVRHDTNGNGKTDISKDGGGMSNNPSINILNLGKPSVSKVAFKVGTGVTTININLKYM